MPRPRRLKIIPEPPHGSATVLVIDPKIPATVLVFRGLDTKAPDFLCGACDRVLIRGIQRAMIQDVVIKCTCGACNSTARRELLH